MLADGDPLIEAETDELADPEGLIEADGLRDADAEADGLIDCEADGD